MQLGKQNNVRLTPKLEKQLTVLQKNLYQSQRIDVEQGKRQETRLLTMPEIIRLVLTQAFDSPADKIRIEEVEEEEEEEPESLTEKEQAELQKERELAGEVEIELTDLDSKTVAGGWNDDKTLNEELAQNEELEEIEACFEERDRLIKIEKRSGFRETPAHSRKVEALVAKIDAINLKSKAERDKIEQWTAEGRYIGKRRRTKSIGT